MSKFDDLTRRRTSEAPQEVQVPRVVGAEEYPEVNSLSQQLKRGDAKQLKAIVSADLHKRVKMASVALERDISEITAEALENWLNKQREDYK